MNVELFGPPASAVISPCGRYRYHLSRVWTPRRPRVLWIMLNPSTADAAKDDATIRKIRGFVQLWAQAASGPAYGGLEVVNLFAWRATKPAALLTAEEPVGPENDIAIASAAASAALIVCAWGAHWFARHRVESVMKIVRSNAGSCPIVALRRTVDGAPWHPLYVPYAAAPTPF